MPIPEDITMKWLFPKTEKSNDYNKKPTYLFTCQISTQGEIEEDASAKGAEATYIALLEGIKKVLGKKD